MIGRLPGIETADHDIVEVEHTVEALTDLFEGSKVVCNTVGPFIKFGPEVVEACAATGAHYLDTTGEQPFIVEAREKFGDAFRQAGKLLSPSVAYMHTFAEIAAELVLETPGIDVLETACLCRGPRLGASGVTVGSTASIFEACRHEAFYLWEKKLVPHAIDAAVHHL